MGDVSVAGRWLLGIGIYFMMYFIIAHMIFSGIAATDTPAAAAMQDNVNSLSQAKFQEYINQGGFCTTPRCIDDSSAIPCSEQASQSESALYCFYIDTQSSCESTDGCSWNTSCSGDINATWLYFGELPSDIDTDVLGLYNTSGSFIGIFRNYVPLSDTPRLKLDKNLCVDFDFNWVDEAKDLPEITIWNAKDTILTMYGVDNDIAQDDDLSDSFWFYFSLITVWLPTFALIIILVMFVAGVIP